MMSYRKLSLLAVLTITVFVTFGLIGTATAQSFEDMPGPHQDCSTCHESDEVISPVSVNYSSELCGGCHDSAMTDWENSGHTGWGQYPEESTLNDLSYQTSCSCHFTEGGVWDLKTNEEVLDTNNFDPFVQPSTAVKEDLNPGVDCAACHDPHTGELRVNGSELCGSCHNGQGTDAQFDVTTGFEEHHPNHPSWEQWTGESFEWANATEWITSHHGTTAECQDCHPAHTFEFNATYIAEENCNGCHHEDQEGEDLWTEVNNSMNEFEEDYDRVHSKMQEVLNEMGIEIYGGATDHPRDMTQAYQEEYEKLSEAVFYMEFITGEGSFDPGAMAIHNEKLGNQLLTRAETLIDEVEVPSDSSPQLNLEIITGLSDRRAGNEIVVKTTYEGKAIEGATISVGDQTVTTDEEGKATLTFAESGKYDITAEKDRWNPTTNEITVTSTYEGEISQTLTTIQQNVEGIQTTVNDLSDQFSSTVEDATSGIESTLNLTMYIALFALIAVLVVIAKMFIGN